MVSGTVEMVEQLGADTLLHIGHGADDDHRAAAARRPSRVRIDIAPGRGPVDGVPVRHRHRCAHKVIMATLPPWPYPRLCAHRGAGKLAPENTLTAMRVGHAHGYGMVEFDVKLCADNVSFLLHDATLERTTSGRGRADALPWRELARLDAGGWHSAKYAGEMLPTFASIARWARAHGVACNVEIKAMPGPRARDRRRRRPRRRGAVARRRRPAAAVVVRRGVARRRARRGAAAAARAAAGRTAGGLA